MNGPRQIPIYRALFRDQLLLGCDRELLLLVCLLSLGMGVMVMRLIGIIAAVIFFSVSVYLLRRMGKADPMMRQVYLRHITYQEYYPAASRPYRIAKSNKVY